MRKEIISLSRIPAALAIGLLLVGLYLTSLYSYLFFHTLVEIFTIVIASAIFILTWNTRRLLDNGYLLLLGIAYLFVGLIDLFHTLAYKGMQIFPAYNANLPTQLWIGGQYLYSLSLLVAPLGLGRAFKARPILISYAIITGLLLASIFGGIFPDCYIEGAGLTPFKKISEYIISFICLAAASLLFKNRSMFDRDTLGLLVWSIIFSIAAELAFTIYVGVYDLPNLIGHLLRIISFYLIYKAIVEKGLVEPFNLLFRDLKQREATLQQYASQLQERNKELDAFAHTAAHDLRSPLSTISGFTEVLLDYPLSPEERTKSLLAIKQVAFKMSSIIQELLLLAQVRQAEVPITPLDMVGIVAEVQRRLAPMIEEHKSQVILPDGWPVALGYAPWIEEVWANYISNAIKYGRRPARVELGATPQPDRRVRFWVRDNGPGLSPQQQAELFKPFIQLGQVRATGYGLGLSIVRRIMERLGGQAGVESEGLNGHGSLFFFTLPALSPEAETMRPQ